MRQATEKDFIYGTVFFDIEGNEFIIRDKYDEGIFETNKCSVIFVSEARFYTVKE